MVTLILEKTFWEDFDDQIFLCTLDYGFFPLSPFFRGSNNLGAHISNLSSPKGKLGFEAFLFIMITCKMIYVIQCILPSHCFHNVNLSNYGFPYSLRLLHL